MDLSILIPVHDYDASQLVIDFLHISQREGVEAEIIVADDASSTDIRTIGLYPEDEHITYLRFDTNQGRARIRNLLAEVARAPFLLFVDCDAAIPQTFSLRAYLKPLEPLEPLKPLALDSVASVICGGLRHPDVNPNPAATLRYKYERAADRHRSAAIRSQRPYAQLTFFSLLIRRDLFLDIRLDEACTDYGYEDTLFGVELQRRAVPILHIDNPLIHLGLESNATFLTKTETALHTLQHLAPQLQTGSRLLQTVHRLHRLHLAGPVRILYRLTRPLLRRNLLSRHPLLPLFSFYKLGYYLSL